MCFLVESQNQRSTVYQWFGFKITGIVCASISLQRLLTLGLKTKRATVYRLRHKTDGKMKTEWLASRENKSG
jgi:hypothetical protein